MVKVSRNALLASRTIARGCQNHITPRVPSLGHFCEYSATLVTAIHSKTSRVFNQTKLRKMAAVNQSPWVKRNSC